VKSVRVKSVFVCACAFVLPFWLVIPSAASEPVFSRSLLALPQPLYARTNNAISVFSVCVLGSINEKREKAGSLAALGMTSQKGKNKRPSPISSTHGSGRCGYSAVGDTAFIS
jgi:hypothetical protein